MNIDKKNRSQLKGYFVKNSIPTEQQFADLIDGMLNQKDDGIAKASVAEPLSILATTDTADLKKVIDFYERVQDTSPVWSILLNPRIDSNSKPGFCLNDGTGVSRLFIDKNGNVVIGSLSLQGTITPSAGNGSNGIIFPANPGGGGGDLAWIKYYSRNPSDTNAANKEQMTLEIGVSDNTNDHIALMSSGNVGIGTNQPQHKFQIGDDVNGLGFDLGVSPNAGIFRFGDNTGWKLHFGRSRESSGGALNTGVSGILMTISDSGNLSVQGAITPSAGSANNGIIFPNDPGGGSGDTAWIKYCSRFPTDADAAKKEHMVLEIGVSNDADDHIALMPSGNVGIGTIEPKAKLHVNGHIFVNGAVFSNKVLATRTDLGAQTSASAPVVFENVRNSSVSIQAPTSTKIRITLTIDTVTFTTVIVGGVEFGVLLNGTLISLGAISQSTGTAVPVPLPITRSNILLTADATIPEGVSTIVLQWRKLNGTTTSAIIDGNRTLKCEIIS